MTCQEQKHPDSCLSLRKTMLTLAKLQWDENQFLNG